MSKARKVSGVSKYYNTKEQELNKKIMAWKNATKHKQVHKKMKICSIVNNKGH